MRHAHGVDLPPPRAREPSPRADGASTGIGSGRFLAISVILTVVAISVMMPRLLSPQFGLLDDGITLQVSRLVNTSVGEGRFGLIVRLEAERGRFRPLYWVYHAIQYSIWGDVAFGHFLGNTLALLLTALSVAGTVAFATRDSLASLAAGLAYVLAPPVIESYYTLSKPEVPLALWLGASLCGWAGARSGWTLAPQRSRRLLAASAILLLLAYLTKETAQAVLLATALWVVVQWGMRGRIGTGRVRIDRWYLGANVACAALFWVAREAAGTASVATGGDSSHYAFTGHAIVAGALGHLTWCLRDFPFLLPLVAFQWWTRRHHPRDDPWMAGVPILWILAWTAIMLPWHSIHEYYLLPSSLGVSLIMGTGLACAVRSIRDVRAPVRILARAIAVAMLILTPFILGNMVTNARIQLAVDAANAHLVDYLARIVPSGGTVLVNIPAPNEYMEELTAHLRALKGRGDITVAYASHRLRERETRALLVSPVMANEPFPTVRLAVSELGARHSLAEFQARAQGQAPLVYRHAEQVRLLMTQIQRPLCPVLAKAQAFREFFCHARRQLIDTRAFEYGWEVYALGAI